MMMKILVLGAGVLGCNLANDLFRAGKDAVGEMNALNRDIKRLFENTGAEYSTWQALERECGRYLGRNI